MAALSEVELHANSFMNSEITLKLKINNGGMAGNGVSMCRKHLQMKMGLFS